ncbi:MAG: TetR/AcrR family transcriptional regulator [Myxococcota bacterium]|nr:TetR/AcrR family transcriptional regulator [Myxococcota bacterium]
MAHKPKPAYHHGALREALLKAASELVSSEGISALTLREVARRAGVTHAAPYHHFKDRPALLAALGQEGFDGLHHAMRAEMERAGDDPLARFAATGRGYLKFALEKPSHLRVMFSAELGPKDAHPGLLEAGERAFGALLEASREAILSLGGDEAKAYEYALAGWSGVHGLAMLWLDGPLREEVVNAVDIHRLGASTVAILIDGMKAQIASAKRAAKPARPPK